ncbi:uncharacterized protein G2W53_030716 [Senna tora]|uniref:Uncharacterized protein n=1 Tax=Senna tora TaxID=362788 RepID=A0A834T7I7_9FABA|nr:uncharacterized protein G2W53_030716 [Senna tora]
MAARRAYDRTKQEAVIDGFIVGRVL